MSFVFDDWLKVMVKRGEEECWVKQWSHSEGDGDDGRETLAETGSDGDKGRVTVGETMKVMVTQEGNVGWN